MAASVDTDAVLAAFSHDNSTLATGYLQHALFVDFVPRHHLTLSATYHRNRRKEALAPIDWQNRVRLNSLASF